MQTDPHAPSSPSNDSDTAWSPQLSARRLWARRFAMTAAIVDRFCGRTNDGLALVALVLAAFLVMRLTISAVGGHPEYFYPLDAETLAAELTISP